MRDSRAFKDMADLLYAIAVAEVEIARDTAALEKKKQHCKHLRGQYRGRINAAIRECQPYQGVPAMTTDSAPERIWAAPYENDWSRAGFHFCWIRETLPATPYIRQDIADAAVEAARAEERERCAKIVHTHADLHLFYDNWSPDSRYAVMEARTVIAAAIRETGDE